MRSSLSFLLPGGLLASVLTAGEPPAAIPVLPAAAVQSADAPADLTLLPLKLPGYELRVLDRRKALRFDVGGATYEVRLPIFFYVPAGDRAQALRLLRQAADDLKHAAHEPDRNEIDLEALIGRIEHGLALLGPR